ncbi:MAG TPA: WecB/TagA/CpsF family glycosyltransferase [Actinomycetota bacterium]|jgi:exopolysaccharide biosynthesis WecB/TagA/CpsF family protein|nr:WecB/TagA/CpsF family glycosyltransferase [Actinomycetota bacterium]
MLPGLPCVDILGVPVARLRRAEALDAVERAAEEMPPALVVYANAHTINVACADPAYLALLRDRTAVILNDGSGVAIAGRLAGAPFYENLNGTDFNPSILGIAARRGWPVFFIGAAPGVADRAAAILVDRIPGLDVVGIADGYAGAASEESLVARVRDAGAQVVMVGMGNPLQEEWLDRNLVRTGARLGVGVGAFFDFTAGEKPRAPEWLIRLGLEWVHRLLVEPRRLWRRYVVGNPLFLARILRRRPRPAVTS